MAKYHWNIQEIRKNIKELEHLSKIETDIEKRRIILETLKLYDSMLQGITRNKEKNSNQHMKDNNTSDMIQALEEYRMYLDVSDEKYVNLFLNTYPFLENFHLESAFDYIIPFNNEVLLEINDDFLRTYLPDCLLHKYEQERVDVHIQSMMGNNRGCTFIDPILQKKYILFNRQNDIMDLGVMPHESFHSIFNNFDSYRIGYNELRYTQEIEGSFANFLFADYYKKENQELALEYEKTLLTDYYYRTLSFLILANYLQSIKKNGNIRGHKFQKFLNCYKLDKMLDTNAILSIIDGYEDATDAITYNYSFLASLDLYEIWKQDPEFSFYLLQNIRYMRTDDDVFNLLRRNHITFMDDGFQNLQKYIKNLSKQDSAIRKP